MGYKIDGLMIVTPPAPVSEDPGKLTDSEVDEHVRHWNKPQLDPNSDAIRPGLLAVQAACQREATEGRNPQNSGVEDCNIAVLNDDAPGGPQGTTSTGVQALFVSKKTGRKHYGDLIAPAWQNQETSDRINATAIVRICRK